MVGIGGGLGEPEMLVGPARGIVRGVDGEGTDRGDLGGRQGSASQRGRWQTAVVLIRADSAMAESESRGDFPACRESRRGRKLPDIEVFARP